MNINILIFITLTSSILISFITFKPVLVFGKKYNFVDKPDLRKNHIIPKVRIGGLIIFSGFIASIFISLIYLDYKDFFSNITQLNIVLIGSSMIFFLGFLDDIYNLSTFLRLFIQFLIAISMFFKGFSIQSIDLSLFLNNSSDFQLPIFLSLILTSFWIVGIMNSFNWMDGLDGLLAGAGIIFSLGLCFFNYIQGNIVDMIISFSLLGSLISFLFFNFKPAKIYMGDCGSNFIGFIISVLTISSFSYSDNQFLLASQSFSKTNLFVGIVFLTYPLLDMVTVIILRIKNQKSIYFPDRNHFHHRLLRSGFNYNQVIILIYATNLLFVLLGLYFLILKYNILLFLMYFLIVIFYLFNSLKK